MKRIFALFMVWMILMGGVASAKVLTGKDSFSGKAYIGSSIHPKKFFNTMYFGKDTSNDVISYELSVSRDRMKDNVLGNVPIELKIDDYPVYELKDYRYKLTGPDSYGVSYNSVIDVNFPLELIEIMKNAKRVAIQFEDILGTEYPYVIPDDTLSEWQQVINATEYDILESLNKKK